MSGWGPSRGALLRHIVGGPAHLQHVEKGQGASMVVSTRAWSHAGCVEDLGTSEGWPDVWWDRMHVWVGPVVWGIIEGHHWGSGMLLWGLGYVVWPGDVVGCMEYVGVLLQGSQGIVCAVQYENNILVGVRVIVSW